MRVVTKLGDVFSARISDTEKKYFQLIAFDLTCLNSDVIRAFAKIYTINEKPELSEIMRGKVQFYAHCVTKTGLKMGFWEKVGNSEEVGNTDTILFRETNDLGRYPRQKIISEDWYIWKINKPTINIGKLSSDYKNAEIGVVLNPENIIYRMRFGVYNMPYYPDFE